MYGNEPYLIYNFYRYMHDCLDWHPGFCIPSFPKKEKEAITKTNKYPD